MNKTSTHKKSPRPRKMSIIPFSVIWFHFKSMSPTYKLILITSLICFVLPGIIGISNPINWIWFVSFLGFMFGSYDLYYKYVKRKNISFIESYQLKVVLQVIQPSWEEQKSGYQSFFIPKQNDCFFMSEDVNKYLRKNADKIKLNFKNNYQNKIFQKIQSNSNIYRDVLLTKYYQSRRNNQMFFDEKKISLLTTIDNKTNSVDIFNSSYFLSFITNELCTTDIEIYEDNSEPELLWSSAQNFPCYDFDNCPTMKTFKSSLMSNHIGCNTLAITNSGRLILWRQGRSAQRSNGLLAPTGSGSLDIKDLDYKHLNLQHLIITGMDRELLEECHKSGDYIDSNVVSQTKIIGFYRWIGKGGLPGFLGVTRLTVDIENIFPNTSEVDNPKYIQTNYSAENIDSLKNTINLLLRQPEKLSVPLYANLYCLSGVTTKHPQYLNFLFD